MKAPLPPHTRSLLLAAATAIFALPLLAEEEEMRLPVNHSIPKSDYYLISGLEIAKTSKDSGIVVGVESDTLILRSNSGSLHRVPSTKLEDMRFNRDLMLSATFVDIDSLVIERVFTAKNDPNRKWAKAVNIGISVDAYLFDKADEAWQKAKDVKEPSYPVYTLEQEMQRDKEKAEAQRLINASREAFRTLDEQRIYKDSLNDAIRVDNNAFDAIKLTFQATPSRPLKDAYAIVIVEYRSLDEPVSARHTWIQFSEIGDLEPKLNLLRIQGGGLPTGYVLLGARLHLYENGTELATSASAQCAPLNWAKALQYLQVVYLSNHKADTVPASVAKVLLPRSFGGDVTEQERKRRIRVSVDAKGTPVEFAPLDGDGPISSVHLSYLRQIGFLPALNKGKPVEGTVEFSLAELHSTSGTRA